MYLQKVISRKNVWKIFLSAAWIRGSGSTPKCHGFATLLIGNGPWISKNFKTKIYTCTVLVPFNTSFKELYKVPKQCMVHLWVKPSHDTLLRFSIWRNNSALTYGLKVFLVHANEGLFENFFHVFICNKRNFEGYKSIRYFETFYLLTTPLYSTKPGTRYFSFYVRYTLRWSNS